MAKMNESRELVIGVIGGMGPMATADFLAKLTAATPVATEQDHLRVLIDSNPKIPDRNHAIRGTGESPASAIAETARGLQRSGADFLVMACNTAHAFESAIGDAVSIPFVSMVEEASDACVRRHPSARRVGLLAAPGCLNAGLYQTALSRRGRQTIEPPENYEADFAALLYQIKTSGVSDAVRAGMKALGGALIAAGADVLIAACTEVPLALKDGDLCAPMVDATSNLAERCVRYARRIEAIPTTY
ncbi:Aspartate racemase [Pandoraea terrae]|uniref:Aspartate racemase n=1 Tax=Pandoraea terrae TaxID=1537710 RepID=A0A5E4Y2P8_9BURK|nr:amino acid racemase [Pandoraea terrae]VVE42890.1 Aspartate racemase [Pandoraea terrae]